METSNPKVIAYAIGLTELNKPRMTNDGRRVHGDHRAAEALSEPTEAEMEAARAAVAAESEPSPSWWRPLKTPAEVRLSDQSVAQLAAAVQGKRVSAR
jgi:hypothetical protein